MSAVRFYLDEDSMKWALLMALRQRETDADNIQVKVIVQMF